MQNIDECYQCARDLVAVLYGSVTPNVEVAHVCLFSRSLGVIIESNQDIAFTILFLVWISGVTSSVLVAAKL